MIMRTSNRASQRKSPEPVRTPTFRVRPRILVVDDEPDALELITFNLRSAGFDISTAEDGALVYQVFKQFLHFDNSRLVLPVLWRRLSRGLLRVGVVRTSCKPVGAAGAAAIACGSCVVTGEEWALLPVAIPAM